MELSLRMPHARLHEVMSLVFSHGLDRQLGLHSRFRSSVERVWCAFRLAVLH
jgi:hypothetical protein